MSNPEGQQQYTLKFFTPADPSPNGVPFEHRTATLGGALATAWINQNAGGQALSVLYKDQEIFDADDLQRALSLISKHGGQRGVPPRHEIAEEVAHEVLFERIRKAEQIASECLGEAAVYRDLLETCYKAATEARQSGNVQDLNNVMHLHHFNVPYESDVKEWGKDFLHAYVRDASWLNRTKSALEKIKAQAEKLDVEENSRIAELKESIMEAAKEGLITQI